ncbi:MAG: ectoine hydroxylase [Maribacter sp.]|jgi:ectoine hydroxylase
MGLKNILRRFKPTYAIYNFFNKKKLVHIDEQYKKLGLEKTYFEAVSSVDFKEAKGDQPWLDIKDSNLVLPQHPTFQSLDKKTQNNIINWSNQGYAVLDGFYSEKEVLSINNEIKKIKQKNQAKYQHDSKKLMFAIRESDILLETVNNPKIQSILELLLGKEIQLFQSINFEEGSQQHTHSDTVHMTTFPLGNLIAIWIALEDVQPGSGVLHYYPGSHKLPYILTADFDHGTNQFFLGKDAYNNYEGKIAEIIDNNTFSKKEFLPKKGDVLIWHANLLHGGNPIIKPGSTRKSMVLHYYAKDVACYHEITQRPALFEE